jgi:hypothetical protein
VIDIERVAAALETACLKHPNNLYLAPDEAIDLARVAVAAVTEQLAEVAADEAWWCLQSATADAPERRGLLSDWVRSFQGPPVNP